MTNEPKVVIIDDDIFLSGIYGVKLEESGFDARHAMTGTEAVELVKRLKPEVIISEVTLSGLDGFSLIELLKEKGELDMERSKFIFLTRENLNEVLDQAKDSGVSLCLSKNEHTFAEVVDMVKNLLE
jgi:CheY-like chemotaxis protein